MAQPAARSRSRSAGFKRRNLPLLLLQARERVLAQFRAILNAHGVTEQQWRIIRALYETGPLEPRQIVTACGISSPSLAGVLARMEELGLVARERLDHDQRRLRVSLTSRSRAMAARMAPDIEATYARLDAMFEPAFMHELHRMLDTLVDRLGNRRDQPHPD